jgi:hypothetical protein
VPINSLQVVESEKLEVWFNGFVNKFQKLYDFWLN